MQLFGKTGGEVKPGYADTLKWYYRRTKNPQDKERCLKLLTKIELQKESEKQQTLKRSRPKTAPKTLSTVSKPHQKSSSKTPTPPQSKTATQDSSERKESKTSYQKQLAASQRLSRPKTVKIRFEQESSTKENLQARPKSAMADIGKKITLT